MSDKMLNQFKAARRAGTPLVAIRSFDPEATMQAIQGISKFKNGGEEIFTPLIEWNCFEGMSHRNESGEVALLAALGTQDAMASQNCVNCLVFAHDIPADSSLRVPANPILFLVNAQNYLSGDNDSHNFVQGLSLLRDKFEKNGRSIVMIGHDFILPSELKHDVLVLDHNMPTGEDLQKIVRSVADANGMSLTIDDVVKSASAMIGLAPFEAKQAFAMSATPKGIDRGSLLERKRQMVSQNKGLTVWFGDEKFDQVGGVEAFKAKCRRIIDGRNSPKVVVWVDEGEKIAGMSKGSGHDTSGTSDDQKAMLLSWIVDNEATGMILDGAPGSGKSHCAKCFGNEAGILTIRLDLGGSKGEGLVGQAENEIRNNLKVIDAVAGKGGAFFIITSNNSQAMDSALKSRMGKGTWFFDLPTAEERKVIWNIYLSKYSELSNYKRTKSGGVVGVNDEGWTGREIRACVMTAWEENITLEEAAKDIIPVSVAEADEIHCMREAAHGKYNSASYAGPYNKNKGTIKSKEPEARKVFSGEE